MIKDM